MEKVKSILEKLYTSSLIVAFTFLMMFGASDINKVSDVATYVAGACLAYLGLSVYFIMKYGKD